MTAILAQSKHNKRLALIRAADAALGNPHDMIDAEPAVNHIGHLRSLGFSVRAIASARGVKPGTAQVVYDRKHPTMRGNVLRKWVALTPQMVFAHADDLAQVPSYAATRRYRALQCMGWRQTDIESAAIKYGGQRAHPNMLDGIGRIAAGRHRAMKAAYEVLAMSAGPSRKTEGTARRKGYAPPMAWDDIENLDSTPETGGEGDYIDMVAVMRTVAGNNAARLMSAERKVAVRILTDMGIGSEKIAINCHVEQRTVLRDRSELKSNVESEAVA